MGTFSSFSFGCRVNQAEIEAINQELLKRGYQSKDTHPDIYILNTCSVTHKAEREARSHIYQVKRSFPSTKIVVTGCAATNWSKTNTKVEGVDYLVDNKGKEYIVDLIEQKYHFKHAKQVKTQKSIDTTMTGLADDTFMRSKRAIIKIQDGCHRFCSFCIVPYLRGLPSSTPIDRIVSQVKALQGFSEVVLTAINTEAYGRDTGESFSELVRSVLEKTTIPRLSFGSIHPWSFQDDFFSLYESYASSPRFVDFFHIPLQSGSNRMLSLMKRGYTREEFVEKLHRIARINPQAQISTDVIVGFLEETDQDFEDTYSFLAETPIARFHVFRYSPREHTASYYLGKRLSKPSPSVQKERSLRLRELSDIKFTVFQQGHVGKSFETLMLEKRKNGHELGLLSNQMQVWVKTEKDFTGEFVHVTITTAKSGMLFGKIS